MDGDLTGDGLVDSRDVDLLKELIKPNSREATDEELQAGDLNGLAVAAKIAQGARFKRQHSAVIGCVLQQGIGKIQCFAGIALPQEQEGGFFHILKAKRNRLGLYRMGVEQRQGDQQRTPELVHIQRHGR